VTTDGVKEAKAVVGNPTSFRDPSSVPTSAPLSAVPSANNRIYGNINIQRIEPVHKHARDANNNHFARRRK
jgi:hypothetical protein